MHYLRLAKPQVPLPDDLIHEVADAEPVDALAGCMERVLRELCDGKVVHAGGVPSRAKVEAGLLRTMRSHRETGSLNL